MEKHLLDMSAAAWARLDEHCAELQLTRGQYIAYLLGLYQGPPIPFPDSWMHPDYRSDA